MAEKGASSDLLMKFVLHGSPTDPNAVMIGAEGTTKVTFGASSNQLLMGFKEKFVFEVDEFSFKIGSVDDSETDDDKEKTKGTKKSAAASAAPGSYQDFRAGKAHKYPVDVQPIAFSRPIDAASPTLIQNWVNYTGYDSVTIIKRKAAGSAAAGEVFLRLDFVGVLMTKISWENDDEVKESCEFICRSVTVTYRPQLPDGTLGAPVSTFWGMTGQRPVTFGSG
jgi:type VI protein secretion system component Hcp